MISASDDREVGAPARQAIEIISAITTPFTASGDINVSAFSNHLQKIEPYVDGVMVAGTTGEFVVLDEDQRIALITTALEVFGPARTIAHVGSATRRRAASLAKRSLAAGITRCSAITPYYQKASRPSTAEYYAVLREATLGSELYAYIFPDVAGTDITPDALAELARAAEIDGVKLSGMAAASIEAYVKVLPPKFAVWSGDDTNIKRIAAVGARGTVSGLSAVFPELWSSLRDAYIASDQTRIDELQDEVQRIVPLLANIANYKHALRLRGLDEGFVEMSIDEPLDVTVAEIQRTLSHLAEVDLLDDWFAATPTGE